MSVGTLEARLEALKEGGEGVGGPAVAAAGRGGEAESLLRDVLRCRLAAAGPAAPEALAAQARGHLFFRF